jgi:hypothetical protein
MGEDQGTGADLQRSAHDLARMYARPVDGPLEKLLHGKQAVFDIEEQAHEDLVRPLGEQKPEVGACLIGTGQRLPRLVPGGECLEGERDQRDAFWLAQVRGREARKAVLGGNKAQRLLLHGVGHLV